MSDKKRRPLLGVTNRVFIIFILIFCVASAFFNYALAAGELARTIAAFALYRETRANKRRKLAKTIEKLSIPGAVTTHMSMLNMPFASCAVRLDDGELLWHSPMFSALLGRNQPQFESPLTKLIPGLTLKWLKEGKTQAPKDVEIGGKFFAVYGTMARSEEFFLTALLSFVDVTELTNLRRELADSRPVVGVVALDNYEELLKGLPESQKSALLAEIDDKVGALAALTDGVLRKYERDRHLWLFEHSNLKRLIDDKFSVLEHVRQLTGSGGIPATLSIGLGSDGGQLTETMGFANLALEMALSRGGDQVVVNGGQKFDFYGGQSKELEKRTKVKSRVTAGVLREMMRGSSMVLIMSHKNSDMDSIGSAGGLVALARKLGRRAHILINREDTAAKAIVARLEALSEYRGVFISAGDAILMADRETLLIVTDTSRPEMTECPELLQQIRSIALIDHHRRAATYIANAALTFHEPYASSASELVCELAQYTIDPKDLLREEAEGLLGGIAIDTKNFTMHTGVRTFEAAFISPGVTEALSLNIILVLLKAVLASAKESHCFSLRSPFSRRMLSTNISPDSIRSPNCWNDISNEKNAACLPEFFTAFMAILSAILVLPMPGRDATRIKLEFISPPIR
ncbi:phosphoesterase [Clostridia bacterium]|nr:phosphoesterase [Clostridia bacterium]